MTWPSLAAPLACKFGGRSQWACPLQRCQGTSPLKFVALSLLLYNEHAFQQTPQDPPIRSKQEQTLQTAATQQQYRAATQQRTVNNNEQQHGSNGNRNTAEKQRNSMGSMNRSIFGGKPCL